MLRTLVKVISTSPGHRSQQCTENHGYWARLNIASLLTALDFKPYQLTRTNAPTGGKIVFQRWHDGANRDLMKIEYTQSANSYVMPMLT